MVEDVVVVQAQECGAYDPLGAAFHTLVLKATEPEGKSVFDQALDVEDVKKVYLRALNITPGVYRVRFTAYNAAGDEITHLVLKYIDHVVASDRKGYAALR